MTSNTSGKKVVLNSIIYSASGLLIKCFSFFLLPLYTAYLTTEDYGITSIAGSFIRTTEFIVAFSLFSAVSGSSLSALAGPFAISEENCPYSSASAAVVSSRSPSRSSAPALFSVAVSAASYG